MAQTTGGSDDWWLSIDEHPKVLFLCAALQLFCPKPVALQWIVVIKVQDLAFGHAEAHTIGPSLSRSLCRAFLPAGRSTLPPNK